MKTSAEWNALNNYLRNVFMQTIYEASKKLAVAEINILEFDLFY